jgi:hypothetical protein
MEALTSFIPLIILIAIVVIIVRWRKSVRYMKQGGTDNHKAHGIEPVKPSGKSSAKARRKRAGPYPGIELGKRIIFGGIELKRLDKEIAADIEGRSDVNLVFDIEPDAHKYAGAFAVWAEGPRINDFVGYLPKEVAQDIREYGIFDDLTVRVDHIWIGDRGGAIVRVNIDGPPSIIELMKNSKLKKVTR